ncbi:leader peptidase (prepilin peptidase)/N-methyltransferase [Arthrobacter sp. CAN_A212]|uniref:prepilin peptidase n=1 Tax=unclassified Arthrobacter TaxID=235627 RepID=UPI0018CAC272|nr:A24 family peptidase [Arthrobacter sp. CAN_C5]MBP2217801.1 leader peptidase (prepilin peptidase)/N-methyltransferase [Arthrobacter sp. CAN_C5]
MIEIIARYAAGSSLAALVLALAVGVLLAVGLRLAVVDLRTHRLPNRIIFPTYPVAAVLLGMSALIAGEPARVLSMLTGAVLLWLLYFMLRVAYPAGMGFGDVKLAGLLGLYLGFAGWGYLLWGAFAAFCLGGLWGLALIASRRGTLRSAIPFGPFMIGGAVLVLALPSLG